MVDDRRQSPDPKAHARRPGVEDTHDAPDSTSEFPRLAGGTDNGPFDNGPSNNQPSRWSARARVPPAGAPAGQAADEYVDADPAGAMPERGWLIPLVVGTITVSLVMILMIGLWLIFEAEEDAAQPRPIPTATTSPQASAAVTTGAPHATPTTRTTSAPPPSSTPTRQAVVPDVVGLREEEARQRVADAGLRVEVVRQLTIITRAGTVIGVEPGAGTSVPANSVVRLIVAATPQATMPRLSPSGAAARHVRVFGSI